MFLKVHVYSLTTKLVLLDDEAKWRQRRHTAWGSRNKSIGRDKVGQKKCGAEAARCGATAGTKYYCKHNASVARLSSS